MTLPEIAKELRQHAAALGMARLAELADEIRRRRRSTPVAPKSARCTPEMRKEIRRFARENPGMSQVEIGRRFKVNQGRVSEALHGKRT